MHAANDQCGCDPGKPFRTIVGRHATVVVFSGPDAPAVQYVEHDDVFDEVILGSDSTTVELNSVLLLPGLMSDAECATIVDEIEAKSADRGPATETLSYERFHIPELSSSTRRIFEAVLRERLLPVVSAQLPRVEQFIRSQSHVAPEGVGDCRKLCELPFRFSSHEPAINRYSAGCHFPPHTDNLALTVNVLLDEPGSFSGGGTNFWREAAALETGYSSGAAIRIEPNSGVGVVFNGNVKHSGGPVTVGLRHLLVASFSLATRAESGGPRRSLRGDLWPLIPTFVSVGGDAGMPAVCAETLLQRAHAHEYSARHAYGLRAGLGS